MTNKLYATKVRGQSITAGMDRDVGGVGNLSVCYELRERRYIYEVQGATQETPEEDILAAIYDEARNEIGSAIFEDGPDFSDLFVVIQEIDDEDCERFTVIISGNVYATKGGAKW